MKFIFFSTALLMNCSLLWASRGANESFSCSGKDSARIVKLETDFTIALMHTDKATFERLLAPKFIYTENEATYSRSETLSGLMSGHDKVESAFNQEMIVHVYGATAVVTGWMTVKGTNAEGHFEHKYRFTDTWIKRHQHWQIVAGHDYLMP
ncbi:MAG: nuclear transport factor 2 family protein [Saprospiraceae bacterium]